MSWWVPLRNVLEHIAITTAKAAAPDLRAALVNAGTAVLGAVAKDGIKHGSQEAIQVALGSVQTDLPHLKLTAQTALAASVAAELHEAGAQQKDDPGQPPAPAAPEPAPAND